MKKVDSILLRIAFFLNTIMFFLVFDLSISEDRYDYQIGYAFLAILTMLNVRYLARLIRQEIEKRS